MLTEEKLLNLLNRIILGEFDEKYNIYIIKYSDPNECYIQLYQKNNRVNAIIEGNKIIYAENKPDDICDLGITLKEENDEISKRYIAKIENTTDKIYISENCFNAYVNYASELRNRKKAEHRRAIEKIFNI